MANSYNSLPVVLNTDTTSFGLNQTLQSTPFGIRVIKLALYVSAGGGSSAGTVTIVDPNDNTELYTPLLVGASSPQNTLLYFDNPTYALNGWRDFKVTGLTATGTTLLIWYRV